MKAKELRDMTNEELNNKLIQDFWDSKEKGIYLSDVLNKWEHVTHINPRDEVCYYYEPVFCAADRAGYRRLDSLENILRREKN